mmetsp:Transcript_31878/g.38013  ORF Transcript_31878/g.38013 Transcript_31878/m.38013 type:complete len:120 (+) Transcript_31878:272-631(+)
MIVTCARPTNAPTMVLTGVNAYIVTFSAAVKPNGTVMTAPTNVGRKDANKTNASSKERYATIEIGVRGINVRREMGNANSGRRKIVCVCKRMEFVEKERIVVVEIVSMMDWVPKDVGSR